MLNVLFASDDNYVPLLGVAITSLIENNQKDFDKINIFILDDEITSKNKKRLENLINNSNHNLYFIKNKNVTDLKIDLYSLGKNQNLTAYSRLFLASLLPKDIDKIIYMDCDVLILGSFKELWMTNIEEHPCGAVLDVTDDFYKTELGFNLEEDYINSGFLLINLKKWRQDNVEEKFIQFMVENQNKFYQHDQGVLNEVFKNQFLILDPKYNFSSRFKVLGYDLARKYGGMKREYYSKDIIDNAKQNPIVVHFIGTHWNELWANENHPYRNLYEKYSELAGFKKEVIEEDAVSPLPTKLIYGSNDNPFFKFILKIIPAYIIYKKIRRDTIKRFKTIGDEHKKLSDLESSSK